MNAKKSFEAKAVAKLGRRARDIHVELGGRATIERITGELDKSLDEWEQKLVRRRGLHSIVNGALRCPDAAGLPWSVSVGEEHVQRPLLTVPEYRTVVGKYMRRSGENRTRAYALAEECFAIHGERIDPLRLLVEAG